ncbi:MAG: alpha/beta hydrolase [Acidimicrobiales bacterium]|jgi:pimeloyl-ACP methyl ester carboxylesterase
MSHRHRRGPLPTRSGAATLTVAIGLAVAACGTTTAGTPTTAAPSTTTAAPPAIAAPPPVTWIVCPDHPTVQCGTVPVPLDYDHPARGQLEIAVTRIPATGGSAPDGTLVLNPGGPGESGNQILPIEYPLLPPQVRADADVVSFDPRGTGASDPLRCGTSLAGVTSAVPVPERPGEVLPGTPVFAGIPRACSAAAPALTPQVDTVDTARDMDRIRQALGLRAISFYGLSYGTVLGTVYAALFPQHLRAMVLDGAVDMFAPLSVQASEEAPAAEQSLTHLLDGCAAQPACPLGPDPTSFFAHLSASMTAHPLPAPGDGDDTPVTVGDLDTATLFAVSVPGFTPLYYSALVDASHGDGSALRGLALEFVVDIDGAPLVDAQWAITCNDTTDHPDPTAAGALARSLAARYPLIGGYAVTYNLGGCVAWPPGSRPVAAERPVDSPPVLVIGNTGDPNTPLVGARHLAAAFPRATQLTWVGWGHTWLLSGSSDTCVQRAVSRYLSGGGLSAPGAVCR